jgi:hypothetical protein
MSPSGASGRWNRDERRGKQRDKREEKGTEERRRKGGNEKVRNSDAPPLGASVSPDRKDVAVGVGKDVERGAFARCVLIEELALQGKPSKAVGQGRAVLRP